MSPAGTLVPRWATEERWGRESQKRQRCDVTGGDQDATLVWTHTGAERAVRGTWEEGLGERQDRVHPTWILSACLVGVGVGVGVGGGVGVGVGEVMGWHGLAWDGLGWDGALFAKR